MLSRVLLILSLIVCSACSSGLPKEISDAQDATQAQLDGILALVERAEVFVGVVCDLQPDSDACEVLTDGVDRAYAASVFVQDALDAGEDAQAHVEALYGIVLKLFREAQDAKKALV